MARKKPSPYPIPTIFNIQLLKTRKSQSEVGLGISVLQLRRLNIKGTTSPQKLPNLVVGNNSGAICIHDNLNTVGRNTWMTSPGSTSE